jgi:hypothetical protein
VPVEECRLMFSTIRAVVRDGKIQLAEKADLPEGASVLVTILPVDTEGEFWQAASESSLADVWDNAEDDVYGQLLKK